MPRTPVYLADVKHPDPKVIAQAAQILRNGGLVAFATETVYGLGADATNPSAVARIFEAKGRPASNPLIVHVHDKLAARDCVATWPDRAEVLAERFWPGPLTLVLPRSSLIPDIVTAGQDTVGVRVPDLAVARWLLLETGRPIAAPSANRSTGVSPTLAKHVFDDLDGKIDLILDSGPTTVGIESTVLDISTETPCVLRPGQITAEQIAEVLGEMVEIGGQTGPAKSPGQMAIHYAPRTPAYRMEPNQVPREPIQKNFMYFVYGDLRDSSFPNLPRHPAGSDRGGCAIDNPEAAALSFYKILHSVDAYGLDFILILPPPGEPQWRALRDRIWRATKPWPGEHA